ncbi:CoA-binding protein [Chloroflexota bacterium]
MKREMPTLDEIFNPRGIAVIGVSPSGSNPFATYVVEALKAAEYPAIYPVNPKYTEAFGLPCYPSISAIPGVVDHVVVCIPAEAVLALLDECATKGVRSVHFFTAGFGESGFAERAELERALLPKAKTGGFRIIGPNCVGISVPKNRFVFDVGIPLEPGPIGLISQSGGHAQDIAYLGRPRGLRFSKIVSYGNALDVDESELLEYLTEDPETEIIASYIEGIKDGKRFLSALKQAAARKPVVIYKGGLTEAGARATHGHTASMATSKSTFTALCRQFGAIMVDSVDELMDVLVALRFAVPCPQGTGVAVLGGGGGPSVLASDEFEQAGFHLPQLSPEVQKELMQFLPLAGSIFVNPVDAQTLVVPKALSATVRMLNRVPDIHMLVYHLGFHPISRWGDGRCSSEGFLRPAVETFTKEQKATGKPILLALRPAPDLNGTKDFLAVQEAFASGGVAVFHSFHQAAKAMSQVMDWNQKRRSSIAAPRQ